MSWSSKPEDLPIKNDLANWTSIIEQNAKLHQETMKAAAEDVIKITGLDTLAKEYNNKMPTHDPYANPGAEIYYECKCGAILDPGTKSFAALNNAAMNTGWKIRWGADSYIPHCPKCGECVE